MKFAEDIFKRATVRGIADYLLFGETPLEEQRDYVTRIQDAYVLLTKLYKYCTLDNRVVQTSFLCGLSAC